LNVVDNVSKAFLLDTEQTKGGGLGNIDRPLFYEHLRVRLYQRGLDQFQINGHDAILDEWENNYGHRDDR
jgi:hypothetical protein